MNQPNILAIDVGTSEVKAALVSYSGEVQACARSSNAVLHPRPDWAEQDPNGWWDAIVSATRELWKQSGQRPEDVSGLVFSCQMFGVLPVDIDGKPLMNAMIWLDTRSRDHARKIVSGFPSVYGYGLLRAARWLSICNGAPSRAGRDTTSKFVWLKDERPDVWDRTHKLLDVKDYLLLRCTGRALTTHDLASGGWLYRTKKGQLGWSDEILRMLDLDTEKLPEVVRSTEVAGELLDDAAADLGLPPGIPVVAGAGDVQSCAIGSGAVRDKELHLCLGTSSWLAAHLDDRKVSPFAATGTLCAAEHGKYLLIATQETAGASQEWLRRKILGESLDYDQINQLVESSEPGARGVSFFPWLMGERVPVDDPAVRGGFVNLGLDHDRSDLLRAVYEGVGYNVKWAHRVVEKLLGGRTRSLRIAGGGAQSDIWCQIMADILDTEIQRVRNPQFSTVRGAALIALRALGELSCLEDAADLVTTTASFEPRAEHRALYDERFALFLDYYKRNRRWYRRFNAGADGFAG
jgi:xylulokinase